MSLPHARPHQDLPVGTDMENLQPSWGAAPQGSAGGRPAKRARVALACQRCKTRKQKVSFCHTFHQESILF